MSASGDEKKTIDVTKALQAIKVQKTEALEKEKLERETPSLRLARIKKTLASGTVKGATTGVPESVKEIAKKKEVLASGTVKAVTTGTPKPTEPIRSALTKPKAPTFDKVIQGFYDKSNYPSKNEINKALDTYGLAAKDQFKPKTVNEATNRAMYAVTETIGGGVRWATLGLTGSLGAEKRDPRAGLYQGLGAVLTPSVQDMAANYMIGKALQTKAGRALIAKFNKYKGKLTMPKKLTAKQFEELEQLTKIDDPAFWKTAEGRKLYEQISKRVSHYIENPELYTAGASVIPEEVYIYQTLPPGMKPDIYEQFIAKYGDKVDLASKALLALFSSGTIPTVDQVLKDVADYNLNKPIAEMNKTELAQVAKDLGATTEELEEIITIPDIVPDIEPVERTETKTVTMLETEQIQELAQETALETVTPPLKLTKQEQEKRKDMNLSLFRGRVMLYRVNYQYRGDKRENIGPLEARSFSDALGKAQRQRRPNKTLPRVIVVDLIGERKQ